MTSTQNELPESGPAPRAEEAGPRGLTWPGARWWRCDLHVHTPASHDYRDPDVSARDWIEGACSAEIDVVAITDHNSPGFVDAAREAERDASRRLVVIAGTEVTSSEGVHLLVLFGEEAGDDAIKAFLGACGIPADAWGQPEARATKTYFECLEIAGDAYGTVCIAPHADAIPRPGNDCRASLLEGIGDNSNLLRVLGSEWLSAVEVCSTDTDRHDRLRGVQAGRRRPGLSLTYASDAHSIAEIGRTSAWIKMTAPTLEDLRLALTDGDQSVRLHRDGGEPNTPPELRLESISIREARHAGRSAPLQIGFNPWFNAVIGGRGTGKSTLVELTRLVFARTQHLPRSVQKSHDRFAHVYQSREAMER